MEEYLGIVLRVSIMYIYILALLRLSGKRSIGELSAIDFVVATVAGDMFDDVFLSEVPAAQGLVGLGVILLLHTLVALGDSRSQLVHRLAAGQPSVVIQRGSVREAGLRKERTSLDEVWSNLRVRGEDKIQEIAAAAWEPSGQLSVLKETAAREVQKQDLERLKKVIK